MNIPPNLRWSREPGAYRPGAATSARSCTHHSSLSGARPKPKGGNQLHYCTWVDPASRAFSLIRSIGLSPRASQLDDLVVISPFCRLSNHVDLTSSPPNRPVPPGQGVPRQSGPCEVAWLIRRPCECENEAPRRHEELVTDIAHSSWVLLSKRETPKSTPF